MAFFLTHRYGSDEPDPRLTAFTALLREARQLEDAADAVAVTHDSGWAVCVSGRGLVTLENFEDDDVPPRHLAGLGDGEILSLFEAVAEGRLDEIIARPWEPGREPSSARAAATARPAARRERDRCPSSRRHGA